MRDNSRRRPLRQSSLARGSLAAKMTEDGLDAIFSPRSVAVVGASRHPGKIGYEILRNLILNEYQGILYPVNPNAIGIHGVRAYPNILAVPEPVDLAVITVPADLVLEAAEACGKKGVRGLVVITAGFREGGGAGVEREARLLEICRQHGLTMIGPNCMGVIKTHPDIRMDATFGPTPPLRGGICLGPTRGAPRGCVPNGFPRRIGLRGRGRVRSDRRPPGGIDRGVVRLRDGILATAAPSWEPRRDRIRCGRPRDHVRRRARRARHAVGRSGPGDPSVHAHVGAPRGVPPQPDRRSEE